MAVGEGVELSPVVEHVRHQVIAAPCPEAHGVPERQGIPDPAPRPGVPQPLGPVSGQDDEHPAARTRGEYRPVRYRPGGDTAVGAHIPPPPGGVVAGAEQCVPGGVEEPRRVVTGRRVGEVAQFALGQRAQQRSAGIGQRGDAPCGDAEQHRGARVGAAQRVGDRGHSAGRRVGALLLAVLTQSHGGQTDDQGDCQHGAERGGERAAPAPGPGGGPLLRRPLLRRGGQEGRLLGGQTVVVVARAREQFLGPRQAGAPVERARVAGVLQPGAGGVGQLPVVAQPLPVRVDPLAQPRPAGDERLVGELHSGVVGGQQPGPGQPPGDGPHVGVLPPGHLLPAEWAAGVGVALAGLDHAQEQVPGGVRLRR